MVATQGEMPGEAELADEALALAAHSVQLRGDAVEEVVEGAVDGAVDGAVAMV
jgi:hypothetical protein